MIDLSETMCSCLLGGLEDRALERLLEIRHEIARVAAEDLVAALSAEHDLHVLRGAARDHVLREEPRAGHRLVHVVDELVQHDRRSRSRWA